MAARRPAIRPTPVILAILSVLGTAALYGATASLVPLIKFNAVILTLAVITGFLTHAGIQRGFFTTLGVSMVSGVLGALVMWGVWLALEYPPELLASLVKQGPAGAYTFVTSLAQTTSMTVRGASGSTWTQGPDEVRLLWLAETAVIALAPILGALWSPIARRRMSATAA
ncbi:MAG: hypothetical protein KDK12_02830 [Rhodobacteraceae bacterium]|nr:hypothetical protein [Paracoccaceae bacterium]